jgi:hypothetical protein
MADVQDFSEEQKTLLRSIADNINSKYDSVAARSFFGYPYISKSKKKWFPKVDEITGFFRREFKFEFVPVSVTPAYKDDKKIYVVLLPPIKIPDAVRSVKEIPFERYDIACQAQIEWRDSSVGSTCLVLRAIARLEMAPNEVEKFFKSFKETRTIRRVYMEKVPTSAYDVYLDKAPASISGIHTIVARNITLFTLEWPTEERCSQCEDYGHQEEHCWMTRRQAQEKRAEREQRQSAMPQDPNQAKARQEAEQTQKLPQQQKQQPANTSGAAGVSVATPANKTPGKASGATKKLGGQTMYRVKNNAPSSASQSSDSTPATPNTSMEKGEQEKEKDKKLSMFDSDSDDSHEEKSNAKSETTEKIEKEKDKTSDAASAKTGAPKSNVLAKLESIKATRMVPGSPKPNMLKAPRKSTEEWDGAEESSYV